MRPGWSIPESSLSRLKEGLKGFVAGRILRYSALPTADLSLRKLAAIEALSRYNEATPDMLGTLTLDPNLWPTSAVLDWMSILKRVTPEQAARLKEANQILRSRLNFQGTTLGFSTERSDRLWWLMVSTDVNAVRGLLALLDDPLWRKKISQGSRGGRWDASSTGIGTPRLPTLGECWPWRNLAPLLRPCR
jgi:alpha-2-macroglobulin